MPWPPPREQLARNEARPTARRGRVLLPLVGLLLLGGYFYVSLSLKSRILEAEPGAAAPIGCLYSSVGAAAVPSGTRESLILAFALVRLAAFLSLLLFQVLRTSPLGGGRYQGSRSPHLSAPSVRH